MLIGTYYAVLVVTVVLLALPLGTLIDRYAKRYFLAADALTDLVLAATCIWYPTPQMIFAAAVISSIGTIPSAMARTVLLTQSTPRDDYTSVFALQSLARFSGHVAGPLTASLIFAAGLGYTGVFAFFVLSAVAMLFVSLTLAAASPATPTAVA